MVSLGRDLHGHPVAGLLWKRNSEEVHFKNIWDNIPTWECLYVHRKLGLFLSVYMDDIKMVGKSRPSNPCGKFCQRD